MSQSCWELYQAIVQSHTSFGEWPNDWYTGNYRPIAILSPFAKVTERLVYDPLIAFLEKEKNILSKYQFWFRKNHSTEQAILELTDQLKLNIDKNQITCGIFLDLSKAFDTS